MNKKFAFNFLYFVSLIFVLSVFDGQNISLLPTLRAQTKNDLNVSPEFWKKQLDKSLQPRKMPTGLSPKGLAVPEELQNSSVVKQKAKLSEMIAGGYKQPLDYAELAEKRSSGELVELPMATETYVLDLGGNTTEGEFTSFDFEQGTSVLKPESPKYIILKQLADDFNGTKYDLNNPKERKQIKIRLLRLVNPQTRVFLDEIAAAYFKEFKIPLRITSLTRSIEYQIQLNATSASSFLVRGKDSLPPHSSGCAFDVSLKQMTAAEQNFIMKTLAGMEQKGKVDAVRETGESAVFHVFVYADGKPPKI